MVLVAGIDAGSTTTKVVIMEDDRILGYVVLRTGANSQKAAMKALEECLEKVSIGQSQIDYIVGTGYGRESIPLADKQITEISCHAKGVHWLFPYVNAIIDIGGQDSKAILVGPKGKVLDFKMNEKCAAGTGRFLEVMANALQMDLEQFSNLSIRAEKIAEISSTCTVFAESEVISHVANGTPEEEIVAGIHDAIARRVYALAKSLLTGAGVIVFTGGVAKNKSMVKSLEGKIGRELKIPENPQISGAVGAALFAADLAKQGKNRPPV